MPSPLVRFGLDHGVALASIALVSAAVAAAVRRWSNRSACVRTVLAASLAFSLVALAFVDFSAGVSWRSFAPLQLCDVLVPIACWALVRRSATAFELTLTWSVAGTVPALLTPDVAEGFPHARFVLYFLQHGGLVVAAAALVSDGMRPREGAALRAFGWLNALALVVGFVDWLTGANFMYLRAKPGAATPLDFLGPWPVYIVACEPLALLMFSAACAPFRPPPAEPAK